MKIAIENRQPSVCHQRRRDSIHLFVSDRAVKFSWSWWANGTIDAMAHSRCLPCGTTISDWKRPVDSPIDRANTVTIALGLVIVCWRTSARHLSMSATRRQYAIVQECKFLNVTKFSLELNENEIRIKLHFSTLNCTSSQRKMHGMNFYKCACRS